MKRLLSNLVQSIKTSLPCAKVRSVKQSFRPAMEAMEERTALSTFGYGGGWAQPPVWQDPRYAFIYAQAATHNNPIGQLQSGAITKNLLDVIRARINYSPGGPMYGLPAPNPMNAGMVPNVWSGGASGFNPYFNFNFVGNTPNLGYGTGILPYSSSW